MIEQDAIPDEWEIKTLGELGKFRNGKYLPKKDMIDEGEFAVFGSNGVIGRYDDYWVDDERAIIIGRVGSSGEINRHTGKVWVTDNSIVFWPDDSVSDTYTEYFLRGFNFEPLIREASQPLIRQSDVKDIKIPVPPLGEQERIVEHIEERLDRIERLEASVENISRLSEEYEDSLLTYLLLAKDLDSETEGVSLDESVLPEDWKIKSISEVSSVNGNYTYPENEFPEEEFSYISVSEVDGDSGSIIDAQRLLGKECSTRARRRISKNDVIVSTVRPYLRAFALVPEEYDGAIASTAFAVLTAEESVLPEYLYRAVRSPLFVNQLKEKQKGASYPEVRISEVKDSRIPVPPIEKQQDIIETLENINFAKLEKSVSTVDQMFDEYRDSVLAHAFQGKY